MGDRLQHSQEYKKSREQNTFPSFYMRHGFYISLENLNMKKVIMLLMLSFGLAVFATSDGIAQTDEKVKVKKTSTAGQKVTNTFRKKHRKHYKGVKAKVKVDKPSTGQ
jgi:hypothetical protein